MKRGIVSTMLLLMLFVSLFSSLTLVSGDVITEAYHVPEELLYMEPDFYCDINNDGKIDIKDVSIAVKAWGSHGPDFEWPGQEPSENWDRRADINKDNFIDIRDVAPVASRFGLIEDPPVAYSTNFVFDAPQPVWSQEHVCYYLIVRVYVPSELSQQDFYLAGYARYGVLNVKLDSSEIDEIGWVYVNISLGTLYEGWHLLEFEYLDLEWYDSILNFHVATLNSGYAWLARFQVYVPTFGVDDEELKYVVKTHTNFPIDDDYFLKGYADDYIDALSVDGLKWWDWEWNGDPYETIYAWGDGFCYPLGERIGWRDMAFTFGKTWLGGKLDFQVVSWTHQSDRIGNPRFRAVGSLNQADYITVNSAMFYGGSKWKMAENPQFSERYYEARQMIDVSYNDGAKWFNAGFEVGLGLGWAEWALLPGTEDDVGITLNFTTTHFETNLRDHMDWGFWCRQYWNNPTIDVYSFPALEIKGIEYEEHDSFVKTDLTSAIDYAGTVIMFVSTAIIGGATGLLGATVGLGIKGLAAATRILEGQHVSRFDEEISELHHYEVRSHYDLTTSSPPEGEINSESDIIFFKLNPAAGKRCGLTKVVVQGTLKACQWFIGGPGTGPIIVWSAPIGEITISISIPWFLRG